MPEEKKEDAAVIPANPLESEAKVVEVPVDTDIDYKKKFSESSNEAQNLLNKIKEKDALIEELKKPKETVANYSGDLDELYPGFASLPVEEQENLAKYTDGIKKKTLDEVYKDPAIAFAKKTYAEKTWDDAFNEVSNDFPDLKDDKEFKQKYFKAENVPTNIKDIMKDLAKIHLFDRSKDMGAKEAIEQQNRIDIERANGGDKTPTVGRTLEDWDQMARSNPAQFAKHSKEFNSAMESGKLK